MTTRLKINVAAENVGSDLTNFAISVRLNADILTTAELAALVSTPQQVMFYNEAETTELYAELEYANSEEVRYWVTVPTLSSSSDTGV